MKTKKPKRIRAVKAYGGEDLSLVISSPTPGWTEPVYVLRQSDIRALAEQFAKDFNEYWYMRPTQQMSGDDIVKTGLLYALKRAGMTPGKSRQKTRQSVGKGGAK